MSFGVFIGNPFLWFNTSWQLSTTQLLAHSPPGGMTERIGRVKVRKLVGQDKDSLIGKAKAMRAIEVKQGIRVPLPISRQVFSHLQKSMAPITRNSYLGRQMPSL